jgi:SAM-dependent methyltransferase
LTSALSSQIKSCRSCGGTTIREILDLGLSPLANALIERGRLDEPEPKFPLTVVFCADCSLVQITETVHPEILFSHYLYASSYSDTLLKHAEGICNELASTRRLDRESLVVEIASNDGYLLQYFKRLGIPVLGIEPARNIAAIANSRGIETRCEFFSAQLAKRLAKEGVRADVVLANNVLAHVADLNGFVGGVTEILKDDGVARFEFPYAGDLVDRLEFDTIYHEHLCYFSAHAIESLFKRHGLVFTDVERVPIHGGSLRVTAAFVSDESGRERVEALLEYERSRAMNRFDFYETFGVRVEALAGRLKELLGGLRSDGRRVAAYGAAAKGAVLLNYLALDRGVIEYVVDRNPLKHGLFMPGTHQEVFPPDRLAHDVPDYLLLLTWNFAEEILKQQESYKQAGGRFIIPVPEPKIL